MLLSAVLASPERLFVSHSAGSAALVLLPRWQLWKGLPQGKTHPLEADLTYGSL